MLLLQVGAVLELFRASAATKRHYRPPRGQARLRLLSKDTKIAALGVILEFACIARYGVYPRPQPPRTSWCPPLTLLHRIDVTRSFKARLRTRLNCSTNLVPRTLSVAGHAPIRSK